MISLVPQKLWPLNFFQIHGTICCESMQKAYDAKPFLRNFACYDAQSISEANVLIIWGSLSKKLTDILNDRLDDLLVGSFVLHIQGCSQRIDNLYTFCDLTNRLTINKVVSRCELNHDDYRSIIREARACLRA